jgi:hypothetical protein
MASGRAAEFQAGTGSGWEEVRFTIQKVQDPEQGHFPGAAALGRPFAGISRAGQAAVRMWDSGL